MLYARTNKTKVFDNRKGFSGLSNRAELRIYSPVTSSPTVGANLCVSHHTGTDTQANAGSDTQVSPYPIVNKQRKKKLLAAVLSEAELFAQCNSLEINGVKNNQSLPSGDAGPVIYQCEAIPAELNLQIRVIKSDSDIRRTFAAEADAILNSNDFKGLLAATTALCPPMKYKRSIKKKNNLITIR